MAVATNSAEVAAPRWHAGWALGAAYASALLLLCAVGGWGLHAVEPAPEQAVTTAVADAVGAVTGAGMLRREPAVSYADPGRWLLGGLAALGALTHMVFGSLAAIRLWRRVGGLAQAPSHAGLASEHEPARVRAAPGVLAVTLGGGVLLGVSLLWAGVFAWLGDRTAGAGAALGRGLSVATHLGTDWTLSDTGEHTPPGWTDLAGAAPAIALTSLGVAVLWGWRLGWPAARRAAAFWVGITLAGAVLLGSVQGFAWMRAAAGVGVTAGAQQAEAVTPGGVSRVVGAGVWGAIDARSAATETTERDADRWARWMLAAAGGATGGAAGGLGAVWLGVVGLRSSQHTPPRVWAGLVGVMLTLLLLVGVGAFGLMLVEREGPGVSGWIEAAGSSVFAAGFGRESVLGVGGVTRFGAWWVAGLSVLGRWAPVAWMAWAAAGRPAGGAGPD